MAEQVLDLWPEIEPAKVATPVSILKQQAALLGKHTGNLLEARVVTMPARGGRFAHRFVIVAPTLGGYEYELFQISNDVKLYPVEVEWANVSSLPAHTLELKTEQALMNWLKEALQSAETKRILESLLAQVES